MPDEREKVLRLVEYLQELATLRTIPVRDISTYEKKGKVLWLSDCPREQGVFTQAWGRNEEHDPDEWLKVQHRQEPPLPAVPDQCKDWVNYEALQNKNNLPEQPPLPAVPDQCEEWVNLDDLWNKNDLPELLPKSTQQIQNPDGRKDTDQPETIPKTKHLKIKEVKQEWDRYVENKWFPWTEKHNAWEKDHKPKLLPEISNPDWHKNLDQPETIPQIKHLEDYPEVEQIWEDYVQKKWLPWTKKHDVWKRVQEVYSDLFTIYHEQLRLGEEYELVFGLGLLNWQTSTGQRVHRHLIVADALLEFEADMKKFTVRPPTQGAKLRPELDMLDIEEQPSDAKEIAKSRLDVAEDDPWETSCVEGALKALVNLIDSQGKYNDTLKTNNDDATAQPIVEYAPALILRERSATDLIDTLRRIKKQIENNEPIPDGFAALADIYPEDEPNLGNELRGTNVALDGEIFFPKPSNEQQRSIVNIIHQANIVLVQGPPGTGKSHTIANLICHLLATGKRILVTAKTPRALQVLEGHLPQELRPLCISLLGSGRKEHHALETSVKGILRKSEDWSEDDNKQQCEENEDRLDTLRKKKAEIDRQIRDIRESETHKQSIAEGAYQGTAARIAKAVNRDRYDYDWFTDSVSWDRDRPRNISTNHLQSVLAALRRFTPEMRKELNLAWPQTLPSLELFANLVQNEKNANQEEQDSMQGADERLTDLLEKNDPSVIKAIRNAFSSFRDARRKLRTARHLWMNNAESDILGGESRRWHQRLRVTSRVIKSVEELVVIADEASFEFPDTLNIRLLHADALILRDYMRNGEKLGLGPRLLRPKPVRDRFYVIKDVNIDGHPCSTVEHFAKLADALHVRIECEKAWDAWEGLSEKTEKLYTFQLDELKSLHDALEKALVLEERMAECREVINQFPGMDKPTWVDEAQIERIIFSCRLALACIGKDRAGEEIDDVEKSISRVIEKDDIHPVTNDLLSAIRKRNTDEFAQCASKIQNLEKQYQHLQEMDESLSQLRDELPELAESMETTYAQPHWEKRIQCIDDAWHWGQARHWIEDYIRKGDVPGLNMQARQIEDKINDNISELASLHAWSFCINRLQDKHRRYMVAWQQAIRRLGRGTGRHAPRSRREARGHLNKCREAVPAWVMPLYRVLDTIPSTLGEFDVVIVDEASQCDFEAYFLLSLAKKIVIVGDDKQISPDAAFLNRDDERLLMEKHLHDFDHKDSFSVKSSLFDQGQLRNRSQQITLRDHFRCMPEIIRFSNRLCYADTPLIPLRQYGADRLPPLEHVFLKNAYSKKIGNQTVNPLEAEAIVERIIEMCEDKQYDGKTMGVVVLQGVAQAKLIQSNLLKRLGAEVMEERRLVCGNPYNFQGDERDIMLLSLVVASGENSERFRALTMAEDERRFNVAASRAKDQMILFHSVTCNDLSSRDLRRQLLEFFQNPQIQQIAGADLNWDELERRAHQDKRQIGNQPQPFGSWFEVDVALELHRKNFRVILQREVAGYRIDMVVEGRQARLAVECDGEHCHGLDRSDADTQRQRQLERCGWEFCRIGETEFYYYRENTLASLWQALEDRGIFPNHDVTEPHEDNSDRNSLSDSDDVPKNDDEDSPSTDSENEGSQPSHPLEAIAEEEIQEAIISALLKCSNQTCTLQSVTSRVLKEVGIRTRGKPFSAFKRRVMQNVDILEEQGRIEKYQATNERIRLIIK